MEKKFIYYNNLYRVTYKNPVRKVKPKKTKTNLIIKGNNNRQIKKLPRVSTPNMVKLINPQIIINGNLRDLTILQDYKTQNTINQQNKPTPRVIQINAKATQYLHKVVTARTP